MVVDYLLRLELNDNEASQVHINDSFPYEQLLALSHAEFTPWFADLVNYLAVKVVPTHMSSQQRKGFFIEVKHYYREDPILDKHCIDQINRRCIPIDEMRQVLQHCTPWSMVDTLEEKGQHQRCCNQGFIGPPCSKRLNHL